MSNKSPAVELSPLPKLDLNQRYSVSEACKYLRISRAFFYKLIGADKLHVIKNFSRVFVSGAEIARLSQQPDPSDTPEPAPTKRGRGRPRGEQATRS